MSNFTPSRISELLRRHGVTPSRRLGQHFLVDANLVRKIVKTAGIGPGHRVLEVGAGVGNLTAALAETGARVVCYEVDGRLGPVLEETLANHAGRVETRMEDALAVDWDTALHGEDWVMVSNLPYGVGTPLLMEMVQNVPSISRFVVMLQREVARRLLASPSSRDYGLPSVIAGLHTSVRRAFDVPPQVFFPRPEVFSSVVVMDRIRPHPDTARAISLAAGAFGKRRKMLRRSLESVLSSPERILAAADIRPEERPESLRPADFLRLAGVVRGWESAG
ncbi:MAG: 16S rRNA (adenine(1518)-N(6)/adenine(1519)-N(6))-dimethyltransferase RsmA [bacterium]|nr:16S rRNA (adenine(1518)-N(6)/adenine(1519)-N(6))-dimethyltransferase RsmA [bacterium]MDE0500672.1 16S rRNA (adenine(1518)-N(6)/adenine(1519)-N(6))-dimethyltransferase RsmA [bacterium]